MDEKGVIELLYKLKSGASDAFAERFRDAIGPMLQRHGINLIHFGQSLADPDSFCLVRGYSSIEEREEQLAEFYGSRNGSSSMTKPSWR